MPMVRNRVADFLMAATLVAVVSGCSNFKPNPTDPRFMGEGAPGDPNFSSILGTDASLFTIGTSKTRAEGGGRGGGGIGVNAFLWRGALDTLSFLPLSSADPFGGVIITDWFSPADAPGERFKATAYILGQDLRSDGIRVSVFRQVNHGGRWADAPVNPSTVSEIENKVLDRARRLREQSSARG